MRAATRVSRSGPGPDQRRRAEGLQIGGHYRLPSGNTVRLDDLSIAGAVAQCTYVGKGSTQTLARGNDVAFVADWLRRYGQLNWGG